MASCIVIGCVLLATDQQLWMEELAVVTSADLVNRGGIEINKDGPWHVFPITRLSEKCFERAAVGEVLCCWVRTAISFETVLEEISCWYISIAMVARNLIL
jgi:hypothetical protein